MKKIYFPVITYFDPKHHEYELVKKMQPLLLKGFETLINKKKILNESKFSQNNYYQIKFDNYLIHRENFVLDNLEEIIEISKKEKYFCAAINDSFITSEPKFIRKDKIYYIYNSNFESEDYKYEYARNIFRSCAAHKINENIESFKKAEKLKKIFVISVKEWRRSELYKNYNSFYISLNSPNLKTQLFEKKLESFLKKITKDDLLVCDYFDQTEVVPKLITSFFEKKSDPPLIFDTHYSFIKINHVKREPNPPFPTMRELQIKNYIKKNNNYELYRKIPTYEDALLQLDFFSMIYNLIINKDLSFENGFDLKKLISNISYYDGKKDTFIGTIQNLNFKNNFNYTNHHLVKVNFKNNKIKYSL